MKLNFGKKTEPAPEPEAAEAEGTVPTTGEEPAVEPQEAAAAEAPEATEPKAKTSNAKKTPEQIQATIDTLTAEYKAIKGTKADLKASKAAIPDDLQERERYLRMRIRKLSKSIGTWVPVRPVKAPEAKAEEAPAAEEAQPAEA